MGKGDKAKLIMFGRGGTTVHYDRNHYQEGYDDPEGFFALRHWHADPPGKLTRPHEPEDCEGAVAIDVRETVENKAGFLMSVHGPMVNVDLPPGMIDRCPDLTKSIVAQAVKQDPGNQFGMLLRTHEAVRERVPGATGPLDHVSIDEYARMWRAAGARIGVVRNGEFVWEK